MKKSRYSEAQIIKILREDEKGISVLELCQQYGISQGTYYNWKSKQGGMDLSMLKRVKALERKNQRLKKMYADSKIG